MRQDIRGRRLRFRERLTIVVVPWIVAFLARLLFFTLRVRVQGREHVSAQKKSGRPWIIGAWHATVLLLPVINRRTPLYGMVSPSRDGEIVARYVGLFGHEPVRGSSSHGGRGALKALIRGLHQGNPACILPDGPLGPPLELQGGVVTLAQLSGAPIIPFHYEADRQWTAEKTWDKHIIPKPFSRLYVCYGEPIPVPRKLDEAEHALFCQKVKEKMLENRQACIDLARGGKG